MAESPEDFRSLQKRFAAHLRDPEHVPGPDDIEDRRMAIYRELFYKNILGLLSGNFPVLKKLYGDERWQQLIREFFVEHRAHTPLFPELPREFLRYAQEQRGPDRGDPPFLLELAHYEWVELALTLDEADLEEVAADPQGDLLQDSPVLSPVAWPLAYSFPVHHIREDYQPEEPGETPTHLCVYRRRDDSIGFMELNAVSARLLTLLQENPGQPGLAYLQQIAREMQHPQPEVVVTGGADLLRDFASKDIILGTQPPPAS